MRSSDVASKPGVPEFEDWDVDRVDLKWEPPKSTGGAPITGYVIEMKEKPSPNWQEATVTDSPQPKGRVTGLKKGSVYQFRVRAVNKAGQSEPSDPTKPHVAKARHRKCLLLEREEFSSWKKTPSELTLLVASA